MSSNTVHSSLFTDIELSLIAIGLFLVISPVHGISAITNPILKTFNIKSPTSLLLFTGLLFGISYYYLTEYVLHPLYGHVKNIRVENFRSGGQGLKGRAMKTYSKNRNGKNNPVGILDYKHWFNTFEEPAPFNNSNNSNNSNNRNNRIINKR
tara:strand:+ start:3110 stop:3565 length:456 start_codon:yes stop_codon:yes gene_type:complete